MTPDPEKPGPVGSPPAHEPPAGPPPGHDRPTGTVPRAPEPADSDEELPLPTGTLFLMMIYIMVMAGMWGAIYFDFIGR